MSLEPNDETWTSGLLDDLFLHIPVETITTEKEESGEKDTCDQSRSKGKESELHNIQDGSSVHVVAKKQDHNAKERLRRMRLHSSYITLGTLLPDPSSSSSSSSKKKWCAPSIMDRVVTYIPKLHSEVQELTHRKQQLVKTVESKSSRELERQEDPHNRAISVLELGGSGDELVLQISMRKEKEDEFSNLLHVMEVQGFSILSASTTLLCPIQTVVCYNFHLKMNGKPCEGDDYITVLKNNIISSLS